MFLVTLRDRRPRYALIWALDWGFAVLFLGVGWLWGATHGLVGSAGCRNEVHVCGMALHGVS